jgi:hypothetical protein
MDAIIDWILTHQLLSVALTVIAVAVAGAIRRLWWIDFSTTADTNVVNEAKRSAGESNRGALEKSLPFTEANYEFTLIYDHIRIGQIDPKKLHRLRRKYLNYIVGMEYPHPDLVEKNHEAITKIQGNVARAKHELNMRNLRWSLLTTALAAFIGARLG